MTNSLRDPDGSASIPHPQAHERSISAAEDANRIASFNGASWISEELSERERQGLLRRRRVVRPLEGAWCEIDGRRLLNFASNDYLNLAGDPRLIAAASAALAECGVGSRASALVCGRTIWHERLEQRLASFEGQQAAVLFPTGLSANIGTVSALAQSGDVVFCDRLNHASLVDGCRLSDATLRVFHHSKLSVLERELTKFAGARRRWIVTDSVFSMDGDLAPLPELCNLAERYGASLIVDEAHGTGVYGRTGRGACELLEVEHRVAVRVGTLSKAIGALGGFVAGPQDLIDFLWNSARSQIYSTSLPPAVCAAAVQAIDIIATDPARRERLHFASQLFRQQLRDKGIEAMASSTGPIVPVGVASSQAAIQIASRLENEGFLVGAIRPPTVPRGTSRLRIVVTAAHTDDDIRRLADALSRCMASEQP